MMMAMTVDDDDDVRDQLMNRVANRAEILCEALGAHVRSGEPVDVQDEFQRLTFDVIG